MNGQYDEAHGQYGNYQKDMVGKTDLMIKLLEKLPKVITKPIVIQHTQTVDEQFKLIVNENKHQPIMANSVPQIQKF